MTHYLLTEDGANSGRFQLQTSEVEAASTTEALAALALLAPEGVRIAAWPYRRMSGLPDPLAPSAAEQGQNYLLLAQSGDTGQMFILTEEAVTSTTVDASFVAIKRQLETGVRYALMSHVVTPSTDAAAQPAAASTTTSAHS